MSAGRPARGGAEEEDRPLQPVEPQGHETVTVSPLTVPLLMAGLIVGFLAGYFLVGWGAIVLGAVVVAAVAAVLRGTEHREAALAAIIGTGAGYFGVILLALWRGAL